MGSTEETPDPSVAELVMIEIDDKLCVGAGACMVHNQTRIQPGSYGTAEVEVGATFPRDHAQEICSDCPSGAISIVELGHGPNR